MTSQPLLRRIFFTLLGCFVALAVVAASFVAIALPFLLPNWLYWVLHGWRYPAVTQAGDAVLTDYGPNRAIDRYVIDLGPIDLSAPSGHAYTVTLAPEIKLTLGLELWTTTSEASMRDLEARLQRREDVRGGDFMRIQDAIKASTSLETVIGIRVVDEEGRLVIQEEARLGDWVWSSTREGHAFLYRGGRDVWIPISKTGSQYRRLDVKAEEGWGTYLTPRKRGIYRITLTVARPTPVSADLKARLVATGGGWE
jgi:hypothetical protein